MRLLLAAFFLLLGLGATLAACGEAPTPTDAPPAGALPTGAPRLRRANTLVRPQGGDATLALASPARVHIFFRRDGAEDRTLFDLVLPGSHLVELKYTAMAHASSRQAAPLPPPEEARAQRTELRSFGFVLEVDGYLGELTLEPKIWTRPGFAQVVSRILAPTRLGEEIPFGSEVELAAIAVADAQPGVLSVRTKDGRTVARVDPPLGREDRLHVLRLILRVESAGDGRSERP